MLDVAVFLLLVSAAVGVLYGMPDAGDEQSADVAPAVATTLATTTTSVEYAPLADEGASSVRTQRGSVLALLARATVANATLGDVGASDGDVAEVSFGDAPAYEDAVREEARAVLRGLESDAAVQVRAVWEPLPGSGLRGETTVGPAPPPGADVHAATTTVPVGTARRTAGAGGPSGTGAAKVRNCRAVAVSVARAVIGQRFPPERTSAALRGDDDARAHVEARYRAVAASVGLDPEWVQRGTDAGETNARLSAALAERLAPTACDGYAEASAVADAAAPAEVTVVVRTWSP